MKPPSAPSGGGYPVKVFQPGRSGRHRRPQPKQTWLFIAVVAVGVAVAWPHVAGVPVPQHVPHRVPWLLLAVGYAAARAATVRFEFSGETHSATLSEVALLVGLVYVGSDQLLLAAVLGTAVVTLWRRERPVKAVFNLTVKAAETMVAVVSFHLVLGGHRPLSGWGWLAGLVAVAAASAFRPCASRPSSGCRWAGPTGPRWAAWRWCWPPSHSPTWPSGRSSWPPWDQPDRGLGRRGPGRRLRLRLPQILRPAP